MTRIRDFILLHRRLSLVTHQADDRCQCSPQLVSPEQAEKLLALPDTNYFIFTGEDVL